MIRKKIKNFCAVILSVFLFVCYSAYAEKIDDFYKEAVNNSESSGSPKIIKCLKNAENYYNKGDIKQAGLSINECLKIERNNPDVLKMKDKIEAVKIRMTEARKKMQEEYYKTANSLYDSGNIFDAMLSAKRAVDVDPDDANSVELFKKSYKDIIDITAGSNKKDKKMFEKAVNFFLNDKFYKAAKILRKLQPSMPKVDDFLSIAVMHSMDEKNIERAVKYFNEALNEMKKERYQKAKEYLFLALEMDKNFLDAKLLLEQAKYETEKLPNTFD